MNVVAMAQKTEVARPLSVLVPLIKDDLDQGREASERAGLPYYRAAGEKMLEAKASADMKHGEFRGWIKRNFKISTETAANYMRLAAHLEKSGALDFSSMSDFIRKTSRPNYNQPSGWHGPVNDIAAKVNIDALAKERQTREREAKMLRELSHRLIDIGYKVLASKLHPDKGGSAEAMARLNKVRSTLKGAI
jgi:hypothetical protein